MAWRLGVPPGVLLFIIGLCSVVALTLGALAWSRTSSLQLPSSAWLPAIVTLLSPLATIAIATGKLSDRNKTNGPNTLRGRIISIVDQLHSMLLTAIATIALTYLFPENILSCHLDQQWQSFFQQKDTQSIRSIQDGLQCCGLRSTHDRAWPFKDRNHGDNACELQLGYSQSCFIPWSEYQRTTSWLVVAAALLSWAVKIGIFQITHRQTSWMDIAASSSRGDYGRITDADVQDEENAVGNQGEIDNGRAILPHTSQSEIEAGRTVTTHTVQGHSNAWEEE